jgi:hypothetical protein
MRVEMAVTDRTHGFENWMRLIQAEYREMPGLHLTKTQIQRLWRLEPDVCDSLLDALVERQFLRQTPRGAFVLDRD